MFSSGKSFKFGAVLVRNKTHPRHAQMIAGHGTLELVADS
jgi:hypothetical protein